MKILYTSGDGWAPQPICDYRLDEGYIDVGSSACRHCPHFGGDISDDQILCKFANNEKMKDIQEKPKFFIMRKDFNTGKIEKYDVLEHLFNQIFDEKGNINKNQFITYTDDFKAVLVTTKDRLRNFIISKFRYYYWSKCEWEFIVIDWPHRDTIEDSRPVKIDGYYQLENNIEFITDLVWNYLEPKMN